MLATVRAVKNFGGTGFTAKELVLDLLAVMEKLGHPGVEDRDSYCRGLRQVCMLETLVCPQNSLRTLRCV
jgi:hypothetical protein